MDLQVCCTHALRFLSFGYENGNGKRACVRAHGSAFFAKLYFIFVLFFFSFSFLSFSDFSQEIEMKQTN